MRGYNNELDHTADFDHYMYTRLLALGLIDSVLTLPVTAAVLVISLLRSGNDSKFWPGFNTAHMKVAQVDTLTTEEWKAEGLWNAVEIRFSQWSCPFTALVFFALFGLTEQKRAQYRKLFWKIMEPLGLIPRMNPITSIIQFRSEFAVSHSSITRDMTA